MPTPAKYETAGTRDVDCRDEIGGICPRLAEARAARALLERQRIELTHRMANVLHVLSIRIEQQRRRHADPAVQDELGRLAASARASGQLHQCLLPPRRVMQLDIGALLRRLATAIEGITGLRCDVETEPLIVPGHVAADLAAAVHELAWNAYKHGYDGAEGGVIQITCRRQAGARMLLSVADRGRGLPPGFNPRASEGFGLMVVYATARHFGGEVRVESGRGACFTLLLPIPGMSVT